MIRVRCYYDHLGLLVVYPSGHLSVDLSCTLHFMSISLIVMSWRKDLTVTHTYLPCFDIYTMERE